MVYFWAAGRNYLLILLPLSTCQWLFSKSSLAFGPASDLPVRRALNSEFGWFEQLKAEDKNIPLCL